MAKSANGSGSIRKRADGTWEARYTVGHDPGTGKPIVKSIYGKRQKDVREKLRAALAAIDAGDYQEPTKITVAQWMDTWLEEYCGSVKPATLFSYRGHVNRYIKPAVGALRLNQLTAIHLQKLINQAHKGSDDRPALSPKTVKNLHGVIHRSLSQAVKIGLIRYNPADAVVLPRREKTEIHPMTDDQIRLFLEEIRGHKLETLFRIAMFTGLRRGEILGLSWGQIDFNTSTIDVCQQLVQDRDTREYSIATTKSSRGRTVRIPPTVQALLMEQRQKQRIQRMAAGSMWCNQWDLVFTGDLGQNLDGKNVYAAFKRVAVKIGAPDLRFHDLRHTYAVSAIRSGDDIKTVQGNLGHATASFTLDVYGHVTEAMRDASAERMEQFISKVSGDTH